MKRTKEEYHQALNQIRKILAEPSISASIQSEGAQALDQIDRFAGELRQAVASLQRKYADIQQHATGRTSQLHEASAAIAQAQKDTCKLKAEREQWERRCSELQAEIDRNTLPDLGDFTMVKAKCLACGLHFMLCTDTPHQHTLDTLHCPECGQHDGHYLVWHEPGRGFIFQNVPGKAALVGIEALHSHAESNGHS